MISMVDLGVISIAVDFSVDFIENEGFGGVCPLNSSVSSCDKPHELMEQRRCHTLSILAAPNKLLLNKAYKVVWKLQNNNVNMFFINILFSGHSCGLIWFQCSQKSQCA